MLVVSPSKEMIKNESDRIICSKIKTYKIKLAVLMGRENLHNFIF
jgi:hypothetical protein